MVGSSETLSATLANAGTANITISSVSETGAGYTLGGLTLLLILGPGKSANFQVTFVPQVQGHLDGSIGFTSDASSSTLYLSVHGTGPSTGVLSASPSSINFGTAAPGNSVTQLAALTNTGAASVTVQQISASGTGFAVSHAALPSTLATRPFPYHTTHRSRDNCRNAERKSGERQLRKCAGRQQRKPIPKCDKFRRIEREHWPSQCFWLRVEHHRIEPANHLDAGAKLHLQHGFCADIGRHCDRQHRHCV
jgi:hypothetical protein